MDFEDLKLDEENVFQECVKKYTDSYQIGTQAIFTNLARGILCYNYVKVDPKWVDHRRGNEVYNWDIAYPMWDIAPSKWVFSSCGI